MSSVDTRVVEARFDNGQFLAGVKSTMDSLSNLQKSLEAQGRTSNTGLDSIARGVDHIASKFNALAATATAAIATITRQAVMAGEQFVKSFTFGPITDGLHEYETQLNSIQTILANTQWEGTTLKDVNGALNQLNHYSDKTIYNFTEMARNVGTFTAAGVKLDTSVQAIKGIANLAAVSGSNAQQASTAMYQLSQALAAGTVKLMDWNSVVNAGMGGKVFQDALKETARNHGIAIDAMVKKEGSFRNTLQNGWLSSKILTETLSKFTGDLSAKQLKQMGYNDKQIKGILKLGKTATDAATKVKTFHQLLDTLKEAAGSGWAKTWQLIFGDFGEAKAMWTQLNTFLSGFISRSAKARNSVLADWKKLGGRTVLIDAVKKAFDSLMSVLKPIHDAFREVFPRQTGKQLYDFTVAVRDFFKHFKMGAEAADNLKRTLAGFFAVLDIGWQILKQTAKFIFDLFGAITKGEGSGGFLGATANIGDFLVALDDAVKHGKGLQKFFEGLKHVLSPIIAVIHAVVGAITGLFGFTAPSADRITKSFKPVTTLGQFIVSLWDKVLSTINKVWVAVQPLAKIIANFFSGIAQGISDAFGGINYEDLLHTINTGLFAGLVLMIRGVINKFKGTKLPGGGFFNSIQNSFQQLTGTLKTMQHVLRATTLLEIAAAVGILAASVVSLSKINAANLTKALTAMTVEFGQLFGALLAFDIIGGVKGLSATSSGLILFAFAIRVLTSSVKALSDLSWNDLAKGLVGTTVLIGGLTLAVRGMSGETSGMISAGAGLILLAAGIRILASAVQQLADLSWSDIAKGLTGVGILLGSLTLFTKFVQADKAGVIQGAGLLLLAAAIKVLASAAQDFAAISWEGLSKGLVSIGLIMAGFVAFSKTIGKTTLTSGATLVLIAASMKILASALNDFAGMSWGEITKGLVTLGGAMLILVVGLKAMQSGVGGAASLLVASAAIRVLAGALLEFSKLSWTEIAKAMIVLGGSMAILVASLIAMEAGIAGAGALLVVSGALVVLSQVLVTMGNMSWMSIIKSLVELGAAMLIIAGLSDVLAESIPFILGFGAAIALFGVGMLGIGVGVSLLATGLTALVLSIIASISAIVGVLPTLVKEVGLILVALAETIKAAAPAMAMAFSAVIYSFSKAIIKDAPVFAKAFMALLDNWLMVIRREAPNIISTMLKVISDILTGIQHRTPEFTDKAAHILVAFINGLTKNIPDLVKAATGLIVTLITAIGNNADRLVTAGTDALIKFIKGFGSNAIRVVKALGQAILLFLYHLDAVINLYEPQIVQEGIKIGVDLVVGFFKGIKQSSGHWFGKIVDVFGGVPLQVASLYESRSPSRVFMRIGRYVTEGFVLGIQGGQDNVKNAFQNLQTIISDAISTTAQNIADAKSKLKELSAAHHKDAAEIEKWTKKLHEANREHTLAVSAMDTLNHKYKDEEEHLKRLGHRYDEYTAKIQKANDKLHQAIQTRNDYDRSVRDTFNQLPDISTDTNLGDYINQEKYQLADIEKFTSVLAKLRKRGLSDRMYKELLSKGTAALPFAEQLLAGGKKSIDEVNNLGSEIAKAARGLASTTSKELYQAGVNAAQGVVDGLKKKRDAIRQTMEDIAREIVRALKKELKIKSPSEIMHELGEFVTKGLAEGMKNATPVVEKATSVVGKSAVDAMRDAIAGINDYAIFEPHLNPTISPVLDLSGVRKEIPKLGDMFSGHTIGVDTAYLKAKYASEGYNANKMAELAASISAQPQTAPGDTIFNQYNTSPKALTAAEIYRQTKNQLSKAKGALTTDVA